MANLKLIIKGRPGTISLRSFLGITNSSFLILSELDSGISGHGQGSLKWLIKEVSMSSLDIEVEPRSKLPDMDFGPKVAKMFVNGFAQLEREGTTPPYFTEMSLEKAKHIVQCIGRDGAIGFSVTYLSQSVDVSIQTSVNIDQLIGVQHHAIGSVEGKLETISIHKSPRFVLYHHLTHKGVTCKVSESMIENAKDYLGRRVIASGIVHYNGRGEPIRVQADSLRVLKREPELPTRDKLSGSDPELTGGMSTEQYLRYVRGG